MSDIQQVGDGQVHVKTRDLLTIVKLPVYLRDKDHPEKGEDRALQMQMLDHDIREAMVLAARSLDANAMAKYSTTGWTWDLEDIQYDIPAPRTVLATLRLTRG